MTLSTTTLCIEWHYAECRYAECRGAVFITTDWYCHDTKIHYYYNVVLAKC
jgi:hypothetical protein